MDNIIFLFSHYDDEFGIFNIIENSVKKNKNVYVFYLTNGLTKKDSDNKKKLLRREKESIRVLAKLGVDRNKIIFLGKKLNIPVYNLHQKLNIVYKNINNFLEKLNGQYIIFTHAWEGGNEDHDASYVIVKKILFYNKKVIKSFQFSQYHRHNIIFYPFKVQNFIPSRSKIFKTKLNFCKKIKYIFYLFSYTSQLYLWIPLYPLIIFKILFGEYGNLRIINKTLNIKKPHPGILLYEKLRKNRYKYFETYYFNFFENN